MKLISIFLVLFISLSVFSQVKGKVVDQNNQPLEMVDIIVKNTTKGTYTNKNGTFSLNLKDGNYTLKVSFIGFKSQQKRIVVKNGISEKVFFKLEEGVFKIDDVIIVGKTKSQRVKEKPFTVASINTKGVKNTVLNTNAILEKISGVNIRRTGGLGSSSSFSLNGMSGKQVKFFLDGIPLDNLGSSLNLDNLPINLVSRIDVFKGVVPVYLGSDALGGAVNIVTNQKKEKYIDVSYGLGSFNTHTFSLLGKYQDEKSGIVGKITSFYNHSDNSYTIDNIDVTDKFGNITGQINDVERNHDAYNSAMLNIQLGVANKKIADEFLIGALFSENKNELQHSYDYQKPFGETETEEKLNQYSVIFKKRNLIKNLDTKIYASLSKNITKFKDTSSYIYYWTKKRKLKTSSTGELGSKTLSRLKDKVSLINASLNYNLKDYKHLVVFNYSKSFLKRVGTDEIPKTFVAFNTPHTVDKNILGISYDSKFINKRLNSSLFLKYYDLGIVGRNYDAFKDKINSIDNRFNEMGYGLATTFIASPKFQIKASYENALRLPDGYEVFGDGALVEANVNLLPEKSNNLNLGFIYKTQLNENLKLHFDANGFYRKLENLIVVLPKIITRSYRNAYDSGIIGVETSFNLNYKDKWLLKSNITKQNIYEILDGENKKIPNSPLLFGNIGLSYNLVKLFEQTDKLGINLATRYVGDYPVYSYSSGNNDKPKINKQIALNFNTNYSFQENKYNISFMINNLTDAVLYDNFKLQQPGRAYYLKLRYTL